MKHLLTRVALSLGCVILTSPAAPADEFTQSFLGNRAFDKSFRPTGPDASRAIRPEPQGVRITLTPDHGRKPAVGLATRFGVRGDFEITLAFDILKVDKPTAGTGAGVSLWITMVSSTNDAATVARLIRPGGEPAFISHRATTPAGGSREHRGGKSVPTESASGKLRLVRSGPTLSYLIAEGESSAFREIYQTELGTEDLDTVRVAADNGGSPTVVDVRLKSVSIRADQFGPPRPLPKPARWPARFAVGLMVILLLAGGFWLWRRYRQADRGDSLPTSGRRVH